MRGSRGINRSNAPTDGKKKKKNMLNSSVSAWRKIKGLRKFFFKGIFARQASARHMQTVSHVRAGGASGRGRKKWERGMILGQRRRKRGQGEGRREERELMRAKRRKEEEKRPSEAVTNKEQLAAVSKVVCFVLRILWEAPETSNALASAECARSLIKEDDRRLCECGGRILRLSAAECVERGAWGGRGEKWEKKRVKKKSKAKAIRKGSSSKE